MKDYKKYDVWIKSHELVLFTYREVLIAFPVNEKYDLMSQLKRATYSISKILLRVVAEIPIKILFIFLIFL